MPRPIRGSGRNRYETETEAKSGNPIARAWNNFNQGLAEKRAHAEFEPEKIEPGRRVIALGIDFGIGFVLSLMVMVTPLVNHFFSGTLVIVLFLIVRDYFFEGRGFGKNLMGFKVVDIFSGNQPSFKQALTRNLVYLGPLLLLQIFALILALIPVPTVTTVINKVLNGLAGLYVLVILPIESYRSYEREDSMRLGDEVAGTCLANSEMSFSNFLSK